MPTSRRRFGAMLAAAAATRFACNAQGTAAAQLDGCKRNLRIIHEAVRCYQRRNAGDYPETLSSLCPDYIADTDTLVCPIAKASGDYETGVFKQGSGDVDPMTSYQYELTKKQRGDIAQLEFKLLQAATPVGRRVPAFRCLEHVDPVSHLGAIHIGLDGQLYETHEYWESGFLDLFPHAYLMPRYVKRSHLSLPEQAPPRPPGFASQLVDLTQSYNGLHTDCWWDTRHPYTLEPLTASQHPPMPVVLGGTEFDVRGVIQLDAAIGQPDEADRAFTCPMFARAVNGIPINATTPRLFLLHATLFPASAGEKVATLTLHHADGLPSELTLIYAINTGCWRPGLDPTTPAANSTQLAWEGQALAQPATALRLFKTEIPLDPERHLVTLDFSSAMTRAAPFIVAISAAD